MGLLQKKNNTNRKKPLDEESGKTLLSISLRLLREFNMNGGNNTGKAELSVSSSENDQFFGLNYSVRYVRWLLRFLGIWALVAPNPSRLEKNLALVVRPLAMFIMSLVIVSLIAEFAAQRAPNSELIGLLAPIIYQSSNIFKHFFLNFRTKDIKDCMKHMKSDWDRIKSPEDGDIMIKYIKIGHRLTLFVTSTMYSGGSLYNFVMPLLAKSYVNEFNETIKPLPYPGGDLFFNVQADVVYEFAFGIYYISALSVITVSMSCFNLALILVHHACGQTQIIVSKLQNLVESKNFHGNDDVIKSPIASIILSHTRLLRFCSQVDKVLKEICLVEVMCETLLLCFLEYHWLSEWGNSDAVAIFTYSLIVMSISFNLFLYCQIGEILKDQCEEVGRAAYMMDWYNLPAKTSIDLILIINMSSRPVQLSAGGMIELSRATFASIMKTSFAYLNMIRTME